MTQAETVNDFLTERSQNAYCDDCIAEQLKFSARQAVFPIASALGTTGDFYRDKGMCSVCKKDGKTVTQRA